MCVFAGGWALIELGAPIGALYALVIAFIAATVRASMGAQSHRAPDSDRASAPTPHPPSP